MNQHVHHESTHAHGHHHAHPHGVVGQGEGAAQSATGAVSAGSWLMRSVGERLGVAAGVCLGLAGVWWWAVSVPG